MKKGLKIATVALATAMAGGTLGALVGCGGGGGGGGGATGKPSGDKNTLTVSIFCNVADTATNQAICDAWRDEYNAKHGTNIKVDLKANDNKEKYFEQLKKDWASGATADIIYLAPRSVKSYAERGNILDLSQYLTVLKDDEGKSLAELTTDVWQNGISYYGYVKGERETYQMGQPIKFNGTQFVLDDGTDKKVGVYGLPKDYSNFSTGYNRLYFSEKLIEEYTTRKAVDKRSVKGPVGEGKVEDQFTSKLTHTEDGEAGVITYAAGPNAGQDANIINPGVPTTYKPYNFFRFNSFAEAVAGRDPVAVMSQEFGGYTVTIPGFPNEILKVDQAAFDLTYGPNGVTFDAINVPYNKNIGHITYTYAEYGALLWACTYYLNTFAWDNGQTNPLRGTGGVYIPELNQYMTVYGGEQYEGVSGASVGSVLYLLPWLAANDADLINHLSTLTKQTGTDANPIDKFTGADWYEKAGKATYTTTKRTLATGENDTPATKNIQFGHNSQRFIETYGAFLAIGSDWNGNPQGDTESKERSSGWVYFRAGRSLFYGAGSWDAATRNDAQREVLDFGQMPTPVAEKYALYSSIKDANYQRRTYSNDPAFAAPGSENEAKQRTNLDAGKKVYEKNEILANQIRRQDKWAARMDTVGYAVSAKVANYPEEHAWKEEAAVSLVARLTINKGAQKTLLYGGAQLPNFVSQCKDFVNYKTATKSKDDMYGDMLTPDGGFWDTAEGKGEAVWNYYYKKALEMDAIARGNNSAQKNQTIADYMKNLKHFDGDKQTEEQIRYNHAYDNYTFAQFTGADASSESRLSYAMRVFNMVAYRAEDRDINIRMQYGLNAVRDSSMYTYDDAWLTAIDARDDTVHMLCYNRQIPLTDAQAKNFSKYVCSDATANAGTFPIWTPAIWCYQRTDRAQELLQQAIQDERNAWAGK